MAIAAASVVLPTPPEPRTSTISLLASSASSPTGVAVAPSATPGTDVQLFGQRLGHEGDDAAAGGLGEQLRHVEHGQPGRDAVAQPLEVAVAGAPAGLGDLRRGEDLAHAWPGRVDEHRLDLARRSTTSDWRRSNSAGSTRLATTADGVTPVSRSRRSSSSIVSDTGISSGVVTTTSPVTAGSSRMSVIHLVCSRTRPTLTSSLITRGAAIWATMCPLASASTTTRS